MFCAQAAAIVPHSELSHQCSIIKIAAIVGLQQGPEAGELQQAGARSIRMGSLPRGLRCCFAAETTKKLDRMQRLGQDLKSLAGRGGLVKNPRGVGVTGEEDYPNLRPETENRKSDLDPVHRLHHYICEEHIERVLRGSRDCIVVAECGDCIESAVLQSHDKTVSDALIPVDDQNAEFG